MSISREEQKKEGINRLRDLVKSLDANPNLVEYLQEDRLYYSYLTAGGFIGSIDTITYDENYVQIVKQIEKRFSCYVYHVIESGFGLALLFVSQHESDWSEERLHNGTIMAYVHNFSDPDFSEFGYVQLDSYQGALVITG